MGKLQARVLQARIWYRPHVSLCIDYFMLKLIVVQDQHTTKAARQKSPISFNSSISVLGRNGEEREARDCASPITIVWHRNGNISMCSIREVSIHNAQREVVKEWC
jgi:hypothetical protein